MILLALLFAAQAESQPTSPEDVVFVSSIVVRNNDLSNRELRTANAYASCMAMPYFALPEEYLAKRKRCRTKHSPRKPSAELASVFEHLDHIVTQNSGSEASLSVTRSGKPNP